MSFIQLIELVSALLGIVCVWLNARPHVAAWPIGLVSVLLAAVVYADARLYAEVGLQGFYFVSGLYGWYSWQKEKTNTNTLVVSRLSKAALIWSLIAGTILSILVAEILLRFTNADFPYIDSALMGFSLVGQVWLARKFIENWLLWMVINLISVGLYAVKGLWFFLFLYSLLFFMAIAGFVRWKKLTLRPI